MTYNLLSDFLCNLRRHQPSFLGAGHLPSDDTWSGGYDYLEQKLMVEKTKKKLEEVAQSGSTEAMIDPPSPIRRHMKWKMACTKKTIQSPCSNAPRPAHAEREQLRVILSGLMPATSICCRRDRASLCMPVLTKPTIVVVQEMTFFSGIAWKIL